MTTRTTRTKPPGLVSPAGGGSTRTAGPYRGRLVRVLPPRTTRTKSETVRQAPPAWVLTEGGGLSGGVGSRRSGAQAKNFDHSSSAVG